MKLRLAHKSFAVNSSEYRAGEAFGDLSAVFSLDLVMVSV
jgi:hypothetical protein